jgi:hypothetical protein
MQFIPAYKLDRPKAAWRLHAVKDVISDLSELARHAAKTLLSIVEMVN